MSNKLYYIIIHIISSLFHEITFQFTPPLNQLQTSVYRLVASYVYIRVSYKCSYVYTAAFASQCVIYVRMRIRVCHYSKVTSTCPVAWLLFQSHCWRRYYLGYFMTLHTCCAFCFHIPNECMGLLCKHLWYCDLY